MKGVSASGGSPVTQLKILAEAGLLAIDRLVDHKSLKRYHLLHTLTCSFPCINHRRLSTLISKRWIWRSRNRNEASCNNGWQHYKKKIVLFWAALSNLRDDRRLVDETDTFHLLAPGEYQPMAKMIFVNLLVAELKASTATYGKH